jgi:hypothetical protein
LPDEISFAMARKRGCLRTSVYQDSVGASILVTALQSFNASLALRSLGECGNDYRWIFCTARRHIAVANCARSSAG